MHTLHKERRKCKMSDEKLTDAGRDKLREYKREWNRRNKDKVKAAQMRYWNRLAEREERSKTT